jgi:hypothetical protein
MRSGNDDTNWQEEMTTHPDNYRSPDSVMDTLYRVIEHALVDPRWNWLPTHDPFAVLPPLQHSVWPTDGKLPVHITTSLPSPPLAPEAAKPTSRCKHNGLWLRRLPAEPPHPSRLILCCYACTTFWIGSPANSPLPFKTRKDAPLE